MQRIYSHSGGRRRFILLLVTGSLGTIPKYQSIARTCTFTQIDRGFRSNANRYGDRSDCEEAIPASRNLISANGARSSLRRTTSVLSKRSDVPQRTFRQSAFASAPACDTMTMFPILFYYIYRNRRTIDTRTICRGLYEIAAQMLRFTMTNKFADARASVRIDKSRVRTHHGT